MGSPKGGGGGGGSTTQTSSVPSYMQPGMQYAYNQSVQNYDNNLGNQYFPGSTVAGFGDQTETGLNQLQQLAQGGSPIIDAAQAQSLKMINGDYLDPASNPYLQALIDQTGRDTVRNYKTAVMPEIASVFNMAGRYGSDAYANASDSAKNNLAQTLGDISTNINYQNYAAERGYQNNAINNAGAIDDLKYNPSRILSQVGAARDAMAQAKLDDEVARFEYNRDAPTQRLNAFIDQLNGIASNQLTQTQTAPKQKSNGLTGALSTAAGLAGIYTGLGGGFSLNGLGQSTGGLLSSSATGPYLPMGF